MTQSAISVNKISYGDNLAVDDISFEVAPGEVIGFLDPNGAGKSTTVKMLTGQLNPDKGTATLLGKDIVKERKQVQSQIGISFEHSNLYEQMTAVENLELFAKLYKVPNFDALDLLEKIGLAGREHERVEGYSKGMKQRPMLARAMVSSPKILFLDEPTDGLDPVSTKTIHALIEEATKKGTTIFLTTHNMHGADKLSNRIAFINKGKIVALDSPAISIMLPGPATGWMELIPSFFIVDALHRILNFDAGWADVGRHLAILFVTGAGVMALGHL